MALNRDPSENGRCGNNTNGRMISETALDWFDRYQEKSHSGSRKRRLRNGFATASSSRKDDEESFEESDVYAATDPSMAAWRFLRFGKSGIAPIDAAWKRMRNGSSEPGRRPVFLPPVTVLEGPKDVGKTWMLLTLAARFVVTTRASRFKDVDRTDNDEKDEAGRKNKRQKEDPDSDSDAIDEDGSSNRNDEDEPKVLLLDSTYDFSIPQLVSIVRLTLLRERQRERQRTKGINQRGRQSQGPRHDTINVEVSDKNGGCTEDDQNHYRQRSRQPQSIEDELERQEREKLSLEQDIEDCLRRIHIIQVDNGLTGWVSMLEAITYQLSDHRRHHIGYKNANNNIRSRGIETSLTGPPTLLLWDGFLSDMSLSTNAMMAQTTSVVLGESIGNNKNSQVLFDSPSTQELLMQLSRLLQKEPDALWLVLTTRTVPVATAVPATINDTASDSHAAAMTEQSGIGLRFTEWIRKEEERRRREKEHSGSPFARERQPLIRRLQLQPNRASYRIRLDRRHDVRAMGDRQIPSTAAAAAALFAKIVGCSGAGTTFGPTCHGTDDNRNAANDKKIPYSISIGGILS